MIVLLDLEWIEGDGNELTQLSAVRTDEHWAELDRLDLLVRPNAACFQNPGHMAFGGYPVARFQSGITAEDCVARFARWLREDDVVLVWAESNLLFLAELWARYLGAPPPRVIAAAKRTRECAKKQHYGVQKLYSLLLRMGERPPQPEHRSSNDLLVMRKVFEKLGMTFEDFEQAAASEPPQQPKQPPQPKPKMTQRERNQKLIDKSLYNFLYLKGSEVFHRRSCKVCLRAKSHEEILGSVYYETAAKGRRPCKLCKPVPLQVEVELPDKDRRPGGAKPYEHAKELTRVRLLTGESISIRRGRVLGWCHHALHPGAVNRSLLEQHDCLGKKCAYFERNARSPYWAARAAEKKAREARKERQRGEKQRKAQEETDLAAVAERWRAYAAELDYDMQIIRVAMDAPDVYRIFYVSDNSFADGNRYPLFLERLKRLYPRCRFVLRHIRDVDGHFVTRSEYRARIKK